LIIDGVPIEPWRIYRDGRTEVTDLRGFQNLPERPRALKCDYCGAMVEILWCRRVRPFGVVTHPVQKWNFCYDGGTWNACGECQPLVVAGDPMGLAAHVCAAQGCLGNLDAFTRLMTAVFACAEDAPVELWSSGEQWPPVRP
jgi:hypothetical protein